MTALNSAEDIMEYINALQPLLLCQGRSYRQFSKQCLGFVDPKDTIRLRFGHFWCVHCRVTNCRKVGQKANIQKTIEVTLQKKQQSQQIAKVERQRRKRMASKINELNEIIKILRRKCAIMQEELSRISKNEFQYYLPNNKKPFRHAEITSACSML